MATASDPRQDDAHDDDGPPAAAHRGLPHAELFEASPFGMFVVDQEGRIADCNEPFLALIGAPRERVIGFHVIDQPEDRCLVPYFLRAMAGERVEVETRYTSTTGGRTSECRYILQPLAGRAPGLAVLGFVEDVFERREMERARRALSL